MLTSQGRHDNWRRRKLTPFCRILNIGECVGATNNRSLLRTRPPDTFLALSRYIVTSTDSELIMAERFKAVVADFLRDALEPERRVLGGLAKVEALGATHEEQLVGRIEDADAIMLYHDLSLTRRTIERLRHCRLIVSRGVGCDNVDWAFAASAAFLSPTFPITAPRRSLIRRSV